MVIFHSYVCLPEGKFNNQKSHHLEFPRNFIIASDIDCDFNLDCILTMNFCDVHPHTAIFSWPTWYFPIFAGSTSILWVWKRSEPCKTVTQRLNFLLDRWRWAGQCVVQHQYLWHHRHLTPGIPGDPMVPSKKLRLCELENGWKWSVYRWWVRKIVALQMVIFHKRNPNHVPWFSMEWENESDINEISSPIYQMLMGYAWHILQQWGYTWDMLCIIYLCYIFYCIYIILFYIYILYYCINIIHK